MSRDDFDTDHDYKAQLFKELIDIIHELGWSVALPNVDEDSIVPGMIIGEQEYIDSIVDQLDDDMEF